MPGSPLQSFGMMDYLLDYADRKRDDREAAKQTRAAEKENLNFTMDPMMMFRGDLMDPRVPHDQATSDIVDTAKSFAIGAPAFAPDLLGLLAKTASQPGGTFAFRGAPPVDSEPVISGDPLRELMGVESGSVPNLIGEALSPGTGGLKTGIAAVKGLGGLLTDAASRFGPELASVGAVAGPKVAGKVVSGKLDQPVEVGAFETTTAGRIRNKTRDQGGSTVNMATGDIPDDGLMMGKFANDDPRNAVLTGDIKRADVDGFVKANQPSLRRIDNFLGTWTDTDTGLTYMDVSRRFDPDQVRQATKFGERSGQLAGFNLGTFEEFPVGNWSEFVKSPEFNSRMLEMQKVGQDYLQAHPTGEWWDMNATLFEEVYGKENLDALAGFIASTAPNTNPTQNLRMASEYMRRQLIGEDILQPDYRIPAGTQTRTEGVQLGMEAGRHNNLLASSRGDIESLRADKVQQEAKALLGDPDAAVFDRWWARIAEKPESGVFTAAQEGAFEASKKTYNQYFDLYTTVKEAASSQGRSVRDFSADVWTGIRETVKDTDQLFGQRFQGSALTGESKGYADLFDDLIKSKAEFLGITTSKMKERLANGDAQLLSLVIGAPLGAYAYSQFSGGAGAGTVRSDGSPHQVGLLGGVGPEI